MLRFAAREDFAGGDIQRGEEVERAVANVVMRPTLRLADVHRQDRLGPLESLNLRFLIEREHHRIGGRIHVQTDDVADLLDELRVRRQLEGFGDVRFETKRPPDATDGRVAHARRRRHGAGTPVRFPGRRGLKGLHDHRLDVVVSNRAGCPHPGLVIQARESAIDEPATPLAHGRIRGPKPPGYGARRRGRRTRARAAPETRAIGLRAPAWSVAAARNVRQPSRSTREWGVRSLPCPFRSQCPFFF